LPTFTGTPELAISVVARWRMPCVPTCGTSARSRIRFQPSEYVYWDIGRSGRKNEGTTKGEGSKRGAVERSATTSSLIGFEISPVLLSGQTTRRFTKST